MPLYISLNNRRCPACGGTIRFPIEGVHPVRVGGGILGECEACGTQYIYKTKKERD